MNSLPDSAFGLTGWTPYRMLRGWGPGVLRPLAALGKPASSGAQAEARAVPLGHGLAPADRDRPRHPVSRAQPGAVGLSPPQQPVGAWGASIDLDGQLPGRWLHPRLHCPAWAPVSCSGRLACASLRVPPSLPLVGQLRRRLAPPCRRHGPASLSKPVRPLRSGGDDTVNRGGLIHVDTSMN